MGVKNKNNLFGSVELKNKKKNLKLMNFFKFLSYNSFGVSLILVTLFIINTLNGYLFESITICYGIIVFLLLNVGHRSYLKYEKYELFVFYDNLSEDDWSNIYDDLKNNVL